MTRKFGNGATISPPLGLASGGTGASSAAAGLANLGGLPSHIIAGNSGPTTLSAGSTSFFTHALASSSQSACYIGAGQDGRFKNLRIVTQGAPGSGQSYTFTLQKLFSDTSLTCAISGSGSNSASDLINIASFAATDRWSIKIVSSAGAATTSSILFSMDYVLGL